MLRLPLVLVAPPTIILHPDSSLYSRDRAIVKLLMRSPQLPVDRRGRQLEVIQIKDTPEGLVRGQGLLMLKRDTKKAVVVVVVVVDISSLVEEGLKKEREVEGEEEEEREEEEEKEEEEEDEESKGSRDHIRTRSATRAVEPTTTEEL